MMLPYVQIMHQFAALILSHDVTDSESAALQLLLLQFLVFLHYYYFTLCATQISYHAKLFN